MPRRRTRPIQHRSRPIQHRGPLVTLALDTTALLGRFLTGPHRRVVVDAMDRLALSGATVQGYIYNRSPLSSPPTRSDESSEAMGVVESPRTRS